MRFSKSWRLSIIWLVPVLLVLLEAFVFLFKTKPGTDFITYFIVFWALRAALTPAIIYFTLRYGIIYHSQVKLTVVHLGGFILFSIVFWSLAFFILRYLTGHGFYTMESLSTVDAFRIIADNSISINIIIYISTVVICYIIKYAERNAALKNSLLTSRLELLKSQFNTHFLFNTLHTISSLVVREENKEANKMLIELSELLRFSLKENKEHLITVTKELELLRIYISIQKSRFSERLYVNIEHDKSNDDAMIPSMILQPLVENAIKYAVEPFSEKGIIVVAIDKYNNSLTVRITDNGRTPFDTINFSNGVGIANTKDRLQELFGQKQMFRISRNEGADGTTIYFEIPFQLHEYGATENPYS